MNITFLNPLFLWGLPLIGIPVIIHLLTKKKARRLTFSDIKFIKLASIKVVQKYRLKELILLLIRVIILFILILLFSRPIFYALPLLGGGKEEASSIVFVLDNSYSMGYKEETETYFARAKKVLMDIVNKLDKKDTAALLLINKEVESPVAYLTNDKRTLFSEIEKSSLSFKSTDISKALVIAYNILNDSISENKQVVILTDLANHGYKNIIDISISKEFLKNFDSHIKFIFIDVGSKNPKNLSVSDAVVEQGVIDQPVKIKAMIENYGDKDTGNLTTSVYITTLEKGPGVKKIAQGFLDIESYKIKSKDFFYNFSKTGLYSGIIEIDTDNLPVDDKFYFKVPVEERLNVLLVDGAPSLSFYNSETYYIKLALNPQNEKSYVNSQICSPNELQTKSLDEFSVIVLCNVSAFDETSPLGEKGLSSNLVTRLYRFLSSGGGIILFAGENVTPQEYNLKFSRFMPGNLVRVEPETEKNNNLFQTIAPVKQTEVESVHPVLKVFVGPEGGELDKAHFYKYLVIVPYPDTKVLLEFSNGVPFLLHRDVDKGTVLFFSSTCDRDWNNLPAKPVYVALVQQAVRYVSKRQDILPEEKIVVGGEIKREFPTAKVPESVKIIDPEKREISIQPFQEDQTYKIEFNQLNTPGIYEIIYNYKNKIEKEYLPVNLDIQTGESNLKKIDKNRLKKIFAQSPLVVIDDVDNIDKEFLSLLKGKELSKSLLIFLVGLIILEGYVANVRRKS